MKQQRRWKRDFECGGYAVFADDTENLPAFIRVKGSQVTLVRVAPEAGREEYLHSECKEYDLTKKRDQTRLRKRGIVGFLYDTPTETKLRW